MEAERMPPNLAEDVREYLSSERRKMDDEYRERECVYQTAQMEIELLKNEIERNRNEFLEELRKRERMIVDFQRESGRLKDALAATNELLRTYIVKGGE